MRTLAPLVLLVLIVALLAPGLVTARDPSLVAIETEANFLTGHPARNPGGTINVVVEIPAGTLEKWEVNETGDRLEWELKKGVRRMVQYLPYPANYGMIPGTLLAEDRGGDGDPLDVVVLGSAIPRGSVVPATPIGVLRLLDDGEQDDKVLAVPAEGPLAGVRSLAELRERFPGVDTIIETWFSHYKGPGRIETRGFGDAAEARGILEAAVAGYTERAAR